MGVVGLVACSAPEDLRSGEDRTGNISMGEGGDRAARQNIMQVLITHHC